ncbi:MAG TPA: hypothetical protein VNY34_00765, partial [Solirubrobacteraceae bacterium]|nr:hypothetical protein [Solirubrobacteraceae bacterium]
MDAGERALDRAGMSAAVMSASQGTYTPAQLQLDITQGARIASSAYRTSLPAPLSLAIGVAGAGRIEGWQAARSRAAAAPQILTPGLLASSIPGGGAYAAPVQDGALLSGQLPPASRTAGS